MPAAELSAVDLDNDGFSTSLAAPQPITGASKSKKAKKKSRKLEKRIEDDEDTPDALSVTPSPPTHTEIAGLPQEKHDVVDSAKHEVSSSPDPESFLIAATRSPSLSTAEVEPMVDVTHVNDFADDTTAFEDVPLEQARTGIDKMIGVHELVGVPLSNKSVVGNGDRDVLLPVRPAKERIPSIQPQSPRQGYLASQRTYKDKLGQSSPPDDFLLPATPKRQPELDRRYSRPQHSFPRRSSLFDATPPHLPQAHFHTVPDFGLGPVAPKETGSDERVIRLDTFSDGGDGAAAARASDVLLVGTQGALDVYRILNNKMEIVARLEGLHGVVLDAKLLPIVTPQDALASKRPLVALIVHGPMLEQESWVRYQTTVEVYSLKTQEHITTLYRSLPITTAQPVIGQFATTPDPVGNLRIDSCGSYITLASGTSGEVWVFLNDQADFYCIAKFWASLQRNIQSDEAFKPLPLVTLSRRWLVIVCPDSSSNVSIGGTAASSDIQAYGITSHNAPLQPPITAVVDKMDKEGMMSQLSRQAAQELLKVSRKGIDIGLSGWKEFTNPAPPVRHARGESQEFPPTHAPLDDDRLDTRPAVVSIIDLQRLPNLPNISTFVLENGCSFLSLNQDGLKLVTTNRKGEASDVWDLTRSIYVTPGKATVTGIEAPREPYVRLIQRISRNSESVVVSAAWSPDDKLALQTRHGTIHLHKINETARRSAVGTKSTATVSISQGMSPPSGFLSSLTTGWQRMSTMKAPEIMTGLTDSANAARAASARMLTRGLAQGYSLAKTGVSEAWHADDNKIRLHGATRWTRDSFVVGAADKVHLLSVVPQAGRLKVERGSKQFVLPSAGTATLAKSVQGFWGIRPVARVEKQADKDDDEMETNPPYCPFHVDRKVALMVWTAQVQVHDEDWCFGEPLPSRECINKLSDLPVGVVVEEDSLVQSERSVFRVDDA